MYLKKYAFSFIARKEENDKRLTKAHYDNLSNKYILRKGSRIAPQNYCEIYVSWLEECVRELKKTS